MMPQQLQHRHLDMGGMADRLGAGGPAGDPAQLDPVRQAPATGVAHASSSCHQVESLHSRLCIYASRHMGHYALACSCLQSCSCI